MRYIPNSAADRARMLEDIGAGSIEDLFSGIPGGLRLQGELALPPSMSEPDLVRFLENAAARNRAREHAFLGAGVYPHYVPAIIDALVSRSEFSTAYTPYQAEIAQGTLQAIFEFQTCMTQLTGLEAANASLYDGSTALAEAVLMAHRITRRTRFLMARTVHPEYRAVVATYTRRLGFQIELIDFDPNAAMDVGTLEDRISSDVAAVVVQSPNFLGTVEETCALSEIAHRHGALSVVCVAEALSLGLLAPPAGADIVVGEAQSLGIPMNFGGPHLGFLATRQDHVRQIPGRLVGMGRDRDGRRAFVLTLATREQHIRRERATSNICTNQSLCALMATIYLAALGPAGLREVAVRNLQKTHYLIDRIRAETETEILFPGPRFNEVVIRPAPEPAKRLQEMRERGIARGLDLGGFFPELGGALLVAVTEVCPRDAIDRFVGELR